MPTLELIMNKENFSPSQERRSVKAETKPATTIDDLVPDTLMMQLDASTQSVLQERSQDLVRAVDSGLVFKKLSANDVKRFFSLEAQDLDLAYELLDTFGTNAAKELVFQPVYLRQFRKESENSELAKALLSEVGIIQTKAVLRNAEQLQSIQEQGGVEWLQNQKDLVGRLKKSVDVNDSEVPGLLLYSNQEKVTIVESISDEKTKQLVLELGLLSKKDESAESLSVRLEFIQTHLSSELIESTFTPQGRELRELLKERLSFLQAIAALANDGQLQELLGQDEYVKSFRKAGQVSKLLFRPRNELVQMRKDREAIPIESKEEGNEASAHEVQDVLSKSGLDELLKRCVGRVSVVSSETLKGAAADYGYYQDEVRIAPAPDKGKFFGSLVHETGHAITTLVATAESGQAMFDYYSVYTIFSGEQHQSAYAESYALRKGRLEHDYVQESFAEDFRMYLVQPDDLSSGKKHLLKQTLDIAIPDIDIEELRGKFQSTLGELYGRSLSDASVPSGCDEVKRLAMKVDRVKAEKGL